MKKITFYIISALTLASLCGCSNANNVAETTALPEGTTRLDVNNSDDTLTFKDDDFVITAKRSYEVIIKSVENGVPKLDAVVVGINERTITLEYTNPSEVDYYVNGDCTLDKKVDGEWTPYPWQDGIADEDGKRMISDESGKVVKIPAGGSGENTYVWCNIYVELTEGSYRLNTFDDNAFYFDVVEK